MRTSLLLPLLLVTGCTLSLPKELVRLADLDACPDESLEALARRAPSFDQRTDTVTLGCALDKLRGSSPAPIHATAAGARICLLLAERSADHQERCERFAAEGVRWAEIAIEQGAEDDAEVRYFLAANLGLAIREHAALAVKNMKRLEAELKHARSLDPRVDQCGPGRALGMLYLLAPAWPEGIGDGDKALEILRECVQRHPKHPLNHVFYARALWDLEEEDAAKEVKHHLVTGRRLLDQGDWGEARKFWMRELVEAAEEAEVPLE
jgi:hypothetical protein